MHNLQADHFRSLRIVSINKIPNSKRVLLKLIALTWFFTANAFAQLLEDISLQTETNRVVAMIRLNSQVHNVRYSPAKKGTTLSILLDQLPAGSAPEEWLDNEALKSPPSSLIPSFTVKLNLKDVQPKLNIEFSREAEYTVSLGSDNRSILIGIKIDTDLPITVGGLPYLPEVLPRPYSKIIPAPADAVTASNINKQAAELMLLGRNALAAADNFAAIDAFNRLLLLPPNDYTQDGQEWIGVARERAGQQDKAKVEYELYLKLYNSGEDFERVKIRLARLGAKPSQPAASIERRTPKRPVKQTIAYGSLSMHYYQGATKIDTVVPFNNELSQSTFSAVDQSALLTSVDVTERFISEEYDNRIVFRDTAYSNFLPGKAGKNRLNSAYFEVKNRLSDYSARIGRQSSSGGGVMGRFDGATAGFAASPSLRVNAVAGQLSDFTLGSKPVFYGASMDMGPVTLYAINQTIDGKLDRTAIGTELRYFETSRTAFVLLDYDTSYSTLNTAMFQGTLSASSERTYNLLLDHRRAPYMSTRNALNGATTTSVEELLQTMSEDELRALAVTRTGTANLAQIGITQQMSQRWQLGGDIRVSSYDGLPASGTTALTGVLPETPGTGNEWTITPQLIGSNLFSSRDVTVLSLSYIASPLYKGQSFYVYSRANLTDKWSLDAALQLYRQNYESGMLMTRVMPMLRTAYQIRQTLNFDLEAGLEKNHTEIVDQSSDVQRQFFSLGFRLDF